MLPVLETSKLCKRFGGIIAVVDVSLRIHRSEFVVISGGNGSGKTTLINLLTGCIRPDSGHVALYGRNVARLGEAARVNLGIARTFQIPKPFRRMTVFENVLVAAEAVRDRQTKASERATEALRLVDLSQKTDVCAGDLTWVETRLLELARAVATHPRVLLVDEILAGLHSDRIASIRQLLSRLQASEATLVVVEHRPVGLLDIADRHLVMTEGRLVEKGVPGLGKATV